MIPNPFSWVQSAVGVIRQTDKSSGFHPIIIVVFLCLAAGTTLILCNSQNVGLEVFSGLLISLPLVCFLAVYAIKAFRDPNFCRSERHVERMAKMEMMGTEKLAISIEEIEAENQERPGIHDVPVHKLSDRKSGSQNG